MNGFYIADFYLYFSPKIFQAFARTDEKKLKVCN